MVDCRHLDRAQLFRAHDQRAAAAGPCARTARLLDCAAVGVAGRGVPARRNGLLHFIARRILKRSARRLAAARSRFAFGGVEPPQATPLSISLPQGERGFWRAGRSSEL